MNLLEHYIKEIYSEEVVEHNGKKYIVADVLVNCYGCIERKIVDWKTVESWEECKKKGYYLA